MSAANRSESEDRHKGRLAGNVGGARLRVNVVNEV
jgi:hypothetical protein